MKAKEAKKLYLKNQGNDIKIELQSIYDHIKEVSLLGYSHCIENRINNINVVKLIEDGYKVEHRNIGSDLAFIQISWK